MVGKRILEEAGFTEQFTVEKLPLPEKLDAQHLQWRESLIKGARDRQYAFTHGIAAKLINGYLKDRFVCGGDHNNERVKCLHPPVDALLLHSLADNNFGGHAREWRRFLMTRWSKFDSKTYQSVIDLMRNSLPAGEPLWKIEQFWGGYQPTRETNA
jgi:hypothetical protein